MQLIDNMIRCRRFETFVTELIDTINKEKDEVSLWEYYLHKVNNKSFLEFKSEVQANSQQAKQKEPEVLKDAISNSKNILNSFIPS